MSAKIYVGGLPYAATESQLHDLFSPHGTVESTRIITDKYTPTASVTSLSCTS